MQRFIAALIIVNLSLTFAEECPPAELIGPCTCVVSGLYGLYLQCDNPLSEVELRAIFHDTPWPDKDFGMISITNYLGESLGKGLFDPLMSDGLTIANSTNLKHLEEGLFDGPIASTIRVIHINENPMYEICDLNFMIGAQRSDITLDMSRNIISSIAAIKEEINIYSFSLNSNKLDRLKSSDFNNILGLAYLYVSENALSEVEAGTFSDLTSLTDLQLRYNNFGPTLHKDAFILPSSLSGLLLDYNNIETVEAGALQGYSGFAYLSLWSNNISSFDEEVWKPILKPLAEGGGLVSLYRNNNLPCNDCSIVWLFLNPSLLNAVDKYYCDDFTTIQEIDATDLINSCTL